MTKTYHSATTPDSVRPKNNPIPHDYVVVVTGASVGLGEVMARQYLEAGAGGIVITGRRPEPLERARSKLEKLASSLDHKVKVTAVAGDASQNSSYAALVSHLEREHGGRLDILVCNAGPGQASQESWGPKIHTAVVDDWDNMIGVNLNGPYYAAQNLLPLMLKAPSEGKTIINIISAGMHMTNGMPPPAYSIAKLATTRLTQIMGEGYADEGLVAYALHPGGVKTPGSLAQMPEAMHYGEYLLPSLVLQCLCV